MPGPWIPRQEVIHALAKAGNADARIQLLEQYDGEILEDCTIALEECKDPWISSDRALAAKALKAYQAGHFEAAMALAVSLAEPLAVWVSTERSMPFDVDDMKQVRTESKSLYGKSKYLWADKKWFAGQGLDVSKVKFKERVLAAPVPSFFAEFRVDAGLPPLKNLSRHVVAHLPTVEHFTKHNSRLALMLVCSILREQESYCAELRAMADMAEDG